MPSYDYFELTLARGAAARAELAKRLIGAAATDGWNAWGLFAAQLGWEASEAALLVERSDNAAAREILAAAPEVLSSRTLELKPTVRPRRSDRLNPGGIYVHRWFEVDRSTLDEFVGLSAQAWPDFENRFDANIFGLFELASERPGAGPDSRHLLLVTRYASHGVWEESRDPTSEAMKIFARRAQLTLSTRAASTLLVAP